MKPYYDHGGITIYHADCREVLPTLEQVDLLLTDPPYGLNQILRSARGLTSGKGEWQGQFKNGLEWDNPIESDLILSLLRMASNAIIWGGNYYPLPPKRGWLIWDKMQEHSSGHCELAWSTLEIPTRTFRMSRGAAYGAGKHHPTEKPLKLIAWCLSFTPDAQTVLDPFMGSGTTLMAAKEAGRKAIGIEIEERYCEIAAKRLAQEVLIAA